MWIVSSGQHNADEATESRGCGESLNLPRLWSCTRDTLSDQQNKQFQNCGDFEQHSFMNIRHSGDWCENFCDLFCDKSGARLGTRGGANTWGEKQSHNGKLEKICLFKSPRLIGVSLGIREVGFICGGRKTWEEWEKWRDKGRPVEKVIADDFILETRN